MKNPVIIIVENKKGIQIFKGKKVIKSYDCKEALEIYKKSKGKLAKYFLENGIIDSPPACFIDTKTY